MGEGAEECGGGVTAPSPEIVLAAGQTLRATDGKVRLITDIDGNDVWWEGDRFWRVDPSEEVHAWIRRTGAVLVNEEGGEG